MEGTRQYKGCLTIRDMYKAYKLITPKDKLKDYKTFSKYIKDCNKELVRLITDEAAMIRLPIRLGLLKVCKFERSYNKPKHKWALDFKATKENGFNVYYDQDYTYAWRWIKKTSVVKNKSKYKFVACRAAKRAVPKALKTLKIDYYQ